MINYESTPHDYKPYADRFPDEAFKEAILTKQDQYNKGADAVQQDASGLDINTLPGADTDKKNEILGKMHDELSQFSGADFSDRNTQSQVQGIIHKYSNDPDLQAVSAHYTDATNLGAKLEKLTANGQSLNPEDKMGNDYWKNYTNSGKYVRNAKASDDVYAATDWTKELHDITKDKWEHLKDLGVIDKDWQTRSPDELAKITDQLRESVKAEVQNNEKLGNTTPNGSLSRLGKYYGSNNDLSKHYQDVATAGTTYNQSIIDQADHQLKVMGNLISNGYTGIIISSCP